MHEIARSVLPGELVFDIGAHIGNKADWFLARGARVVVVEPQPLNVEALRMRFASNPNAVILQNGLSETYGIMTMHINDETVLSTFSPQWKTGRFMNTSWRDQIEVQMRTLDSLVAEYGVPRYVKIDVEGHEKSVMLGLSRKIGAISLEFTTEFFSDVRDLIWYARGLGYDKFNFSLGESDSYELDRWVRADVVVEKLGSACALDALAWGDIYLC